MVVEQRMNESMPTERPARITDNENKILNAGISEIEEQAGMPIPRGLYKACILEDGTVGLLAGERAKAGKISELEEMEIEDFNQAIRESMKEHQGEVAYRLRDSKRSRCTGKFIYL